MDEHKAAHDRTNRGLLRRVDDTVVRPPCGVQTEEVHVLNEDDPTLFDATTSCCSSSAPRSWASWVVTTSTPRRRSPSITARGTCSSR